MTSAVEIQNDRIQAKRSHSYLPAAALLLTMAYLGLAHLSPAALFPGHANYRIMAWIAIFGALSCLPRLIADPARWRSAHSYLVLGLTAAVVASLVGRSSWSGVLFASMQFLVAALAFFLVVGAANTLGNLRVLALTLVAVALFLLLQSMLGWHRDGMNSRFVYSDHMYDASGTVVGSFPRLRSVGFLNDPNDFAQFLLVAASLLGVAWRAGQWRRNLIFVLVPTLFLVYGVLETHSRGGLVGISILAYFLLKKKTNTLFSLLGALTLLFVLYGGGAGGARPNSISEPSTAGRINAWQNGIEMLESSPAFGVGFHFFEEHSRLPAHSAFVQCFAELGLLGYFCWLGLIVYSIADLNGILRNEYASRWTPEVVYVADSVRIALFTFLGTACFLSRTYVMTLYALIGMAAGLRHLLRSKPGAGSGSHQVRWALIAVIGVVSIAMVWAITWLRTV